MEDYFKEDIEGRFVDNIEISIKSVDFSRSEL
jgi:hypothetical protein